MKKIVSVLALAVLTLGLVFADMSLGYTGYTNVFNDDITARKDRNAKQESSWFNQIDEAHVGDTPNSNLVFSLSSDVAGAVFDTAITVNGASKKIKVETDQYYGWLAFGKTVVTVGKWRSRYVSRVNADAGAWSNMFYEVYKPGFVNYYADGNAADALKAANGGTAFTGNFLGAIDSDNLTLNMAADKQELAGAVAFTNDNFMLKLVAINGDWGYLNGYDDNAEDGKLLLKSGLALEVAYRNDAFAVNAFVKTLQKDSVVFGAFLNPLFGNGSSLMVGATVGLYTGDYEKAYGKNSITNVLENQMLLGIDIRGRFVLSDAFALTTMNNFSLFSAKDTALSGMWNMISGLYKFNDTVALQVTLDHKSAFGGKIVDTDIKYDEFGGTSLRLTPAVVLTAGPGATLTAGISYSVSGLGKDLKLGDRSVGEEITEIKQNVCVPLIFKVDL